jgi:hypothetical protein
MTDRLSLPADPVIAQAVLDNSLKEKQIARQYGALGWFFGCNPEVLPVYIGGMVAIISLLGALIYTFYPSSSLPVADLWKIISPFISVVLGYILGAKSTKGN